ncbi:MAG: hypothetical protein ABIH23_14820, partial [bacterium]
HSMGGLVLRSALTLRQPNPFDGVGRIVFVAPPFKGSCSIPEVLIKGEKNGWLSKEEDFRKLARTFPSVYQLIPSFGGAAVDMDGKNLNLFNFRNWQANVTASGMFKQSFLANAKAFHQGGVATHGGTSDAPMLKDSDLRQHAENVLIVLSVGHKTRYQIQVDTNNETNRNWFIFDNNKGFDNNGDERVHMKSAGVQGITLAAFRDAKEHSLVCKDPIVIKAVATWLTTGCAPKLTRRKSSDKATREQPERFIPWDGNETSFPQHISKV